jgi:16S rRNA (uracil1498-N3)-methyltransferase
MFRLLWVLQIIGYFLLIFVLDLNYLIMGFNLKTAFKLSRVYFKSQSSDVMKNSYEVGRKIEIGEPEIVHYLKNVIRLRPNEQVRIFNEVDGEFICSYVNDGIESSRKKGKKASSHEAISFEILAKYRDIAEYLSRPRNQMEINLYFSPIRKENMKIVFEKCSELGADHFYPVITQNCQHRKLFTNDIENNHESKDITSFQNIIIQSSEQSERLFLPKLHRVSTLNEFLTKYVSDPQFPIFICRERSSISLPLLQSLQDYMKSFPSIPIGTTTMRKIPFNLLIGPEGGFTEEEFHQIEEINQQKNPNIRMVSLGENILKAETAAIHSVGLVQSFIDQYLTSTSR